MELHRHLHLNQPRCQPLQRHGVRRGQQRCYSDHERQHHRRRKRDLRWKRHRQPRFAIVLQILRRDRPHWRHPAPELSRVAGGQESVSRNERERQFQIGACRRHIQHQRRQRQLLHLLYADRSTRRDHLCVPTLPQLLHQEQTDGLRHHRFPHQLGARVLAERHERVLWHPDCQWRGVEQPACAAERGNPQRRGSSQGQGPAHDLLEHQR